MTQSSLIQSELTRLVTLVLIRKAILKDFVLGNYYFKKVFQ